MAAVCLKSIVSGSSCVIGRHPSADVVIRHESISGKHCTVTVRQAIDADSTDTIHRPTIVDHSSNGTWIIPRQYHDNPYQLVKNRVTEIHVGDLILLLNPRHPQSHDNQLTLENGISDNELVLCRTSGSFQRLKRSRLAEQSSKLPSAKSSKIAPNEEENNVVLLDVSDDCDTTNTSEIKKQSSTNLIIPSAVICSVVPAPCHSVVTSTTSAPGREGLGSDLSLELCQSCDNIYSSDEIASHRESCSPVQSPHPLVQSESSINSTAKPPSPAYEPQVNRSVVSVQPPTRSDPIELEQCPKCLGTFSVSELISHADGCQSSNAAFEEDKDNCQFCLEVFPVVQLVSHANICPLRHHYTEEETIASLSLAQPYKNSSTATAAIYTTPPVSLALAPADISTSVVTSSTGHHHPAPASVPVPPLIDRGQSQEQCPKCFNLFSVTELISHVVDCSATVSESVEDEVRCEFCSKLFPVSELVYHVNICNKRSKCRESSTDGATNKLTSSDGDDPIERCMKCFRDYPISQLVAHSTECEGEMLGTSTERFKEFLPSVHDVDAMALSVLTPTQQCAVDYVREQSRTEANDRYPALCARIIKLGYTPKDLQKVLQWVRRDAPIIIHLNLDRALHYLVEDTHYRNLFEIGSSGGSSSYGGRKGWEDRMFNKIYHSSPPMERVKYGVLNIVGDPLGVRCCYSYGDSFLQLKKVRLRTTFASMDTSSPSVKLSCCEYYGNVLHEYSDAELKAILDVATRKKPYLKSSMIVHYKEVQIHGPVCLSENVDCIVVSARHRGNRKIESLLDKFIEKNGCNLIWMEAESSGRSRPHLATSGGPSYSYSYYDDEY